MNKELNVRFPVLYKKMPLMPMRLKRCLKLEKEGRGKFRYQRKLKIRYFELTSKPSGFNLQLINLGIDPGSHFDGFSIVSNNSHHHNFQLNHNKEIKKLMTRRSEYRKLRRSRLRHRSIRFDNRTSEKLVPTLRSMLEFRKWIINNIFSIYPVSRVIIEDVAYNHYGDKSGKGSYFSQVEIGKIKLYKWIKNKGVHFSTIKGYITKSIRIKLFGKDLKCKNKGKKSFYAHSIDSFAIATLGLNSIPKVYKKLLDITKVIYVRRYLYQLKCKYKDKKYYFRWKKGGIKEFFVKMSKLRICRIKPEGIHSNHPKKWIYINNGRVECFKLFKKAYGGTRRFGISKYMIFKDIVKDELYQIKNIQSCEYISKNLDRFKLVEYKNQIVEIY